MSNNRLLYDVEAFTDNKATNEKIHSTVMDSNRNTNEKGCAKTVPLVDLVSLESKLWAIDDEGLPCNPDRVKGYNPPIDKKYENYNHTGCNQTFGHIQGCNEHNEETLKKIESKKVIKSSD